MFLLELKDVANSPVKPKLMKGDVSRTNAVLEPHKIPTVVQCEIRSISIPAKPVRMDGVPTMEHIFSHPSCQSVSNWDMNTSHELPRTGIFVRKLSQFLTEAM